MDREETHRDFISREGTFKRLSSILPSGPLARPLRELTASAFSVESEAQQTSSPTRTLKLLCKPSFWILLAFVSGYFTLWIYPAVGVIKAKHFPTAWDLVTCPVLSRTCAWKCHCAKDAPKTCSDLYPGVPESSFLLSGNCQWAKADAAWLDSSLLNLKGEMEGCKTRYAVRIKYTAPSSGNEVRQGRMCTLPTSSPCLRGAMSMLHALADSPLSLRPLASVLLPNRMKIWSHRSTHSSAQLGALS